MVELPAAEVHPATKLGQAVLEVHIPPQYVAFVTGLLQEDVVKKSRQLYVRLDKPRRPRSTGKRSQNAHLNGHVQQIAAYTGDSFDDVKEHIKRESVAMGYPVYTDSFGVVHVQSESECDTTECAMLIDTAHRIASFLGVELKEYE